MESLAAAIERQDWSQAHSIAKKLSLDPCYVYKTQVSTCLKNGQNITTDVWEALLLTDPVWTARAILSDSSPTVERQHQKRLNEIAMDATESWLKKIDNDGVPLLEWLSDAANTLDCDVVVEKLKKVMEDTEEARDACEARWIASERAWRWKLYTELYAVDKITSSGIQSTSQDMTSSDGSEDAWGEDLDLEIPTELPSPSQTEPEYPSFHSFLQQNLRRLALTCASELKLRQVRSIIKECPLDPFRICDQIPLHAQPSDPDYGSDLIALLPRHQIRHPPRLGPDGIIRIIFQSREKDVESYSDEQLTKWYLERVDAIERKTGHIDTAIEIVQHGASFGVAGLEIVAEDLSLLSKLLYEAPNYTSYQWTLDDWRTKSLNEIVEAYLSGSTPQTLTKDINRLVLPYLGVVESRRARISAPNWETTISDSIRFWALSRANDLPLLVAIVQSSSPTLKMPERTIKNNEELARIAIACLYTSSQLDQWGLMNQIFECMPAFPDAEPVPEGFQASKYLQELFTTLQAPNNSDDITHQLHQALTKASAGTLSAIMDSMDDHLTTAEVLARWNVPVKLRDLIVKFQGNRLEQEKLATKMARQEGGLEMESEEEWEALMEGMIDLSKPGRVFDGLEEAHIIRLFFSGLLTSGKFKLAKTLFSSSCGHTLSPQLQEELVISASREYYDNADSGNQNVGEMKLALDCLSAAKPTPQIQQERDFIEATSRLTSFKLCSQPGVLMTPIQIRLKPNKLDLIQQLLSTNGDAYKHPDMILELVNKLGFGPDPSSQIKALAFIVESALSSGDVHAANETCHRMIETLGSMKKRSRNLIPKENLESATDVVWKMCAKLGTHSEPSPRGWSDPDQRSVMLGHAIILCPPEQISMLLVKWREIEAEDPKDKAPSSNTRHPWITVDTQSQAPSSRPDSRMSSAVHLANSASSLTGDLAIRAASKTFGKAAALFPFKTRTFPNLSSGASTPSSTPISTHPDSQRGVEVAPSSDPTGSRSSTPAIDQSLISQPLVNLVGDDGFGISADRLTTALSNKFTSGVGWLIGADEEV